MRYFIGIELPELITLEFLRIQQLMTEERLFTGTIVKPDNLHITLLFLGSLDENELAKILDILSTVSHPPFFAELERLEVPQWHPPRLVWVSLSGDGLANLYSSLLTLLPQYADNRAFTGHCTLARIKNTKDKASLKELIESIDVAPLSFEVRSFSLYASRTEQTGVEYTIIKIYKLEA